MYLIKCKRVKEMGKKYTCDKFVLFLWKMRITHSVYAYILHQQRPDRFNTYCNLFVDDLKEKEKKKKRGEEENKGGRRRRKMEGEREGRRKIQNYGHL